MRSKIPHVTSVLSTLLLCVATTPVLAVTDDDLAAAKRDADYAEAIKRQKLAEKEAADAAAAIVEANNKARLATEKAELDADKARTDYYKSLLPTPPDPKKYSLAAPAAPNYPATATYRNVIAIQDKDNGLVVKLSKAIDAALTSDKVCTDKPKTVILEDPKTKPSIGLYKTTMVFVVDADNQLKAQTAALKKGLEEMVVSGYRLYSAPAVLGALGIISNLGETVISFASILRTQYGAATQSQTTSIDSLLATSVLGHLAGSRSIIDPDAVIDVPLDKTLTTPWDDPTTNAPASSNTLLGLSAKLGSTMREARKLLDSANERIKKDTEAAKKADPKTTFVSQFEKPVQQLAALVDSTNKQLLALYTSDAQGGIPFDIAQKGEAIAVTMASSCAYVLSLKAIASDVDTVAADGIFKGYRVSMATNSVARWKVVRPNGTLLGSGIEYSYSPWSKIQFPD